MSERDLRREEFVKERSAALALLHLTRRDDLRVSAVDDMGGIDLVVEILKNRRSRNRRFAVCTSGSWTNLSQSAIEEAVTEHAKTLIAGPFTLPVCIFFFIMSNNAGYVAWVHEPIVDTEGNYRLRVASAPSVMPLNKRSLDRVIKQVDSWYDAFLAAVVA